MKRLTNTSFGLIKTEYIGFRGTRTFKHWRFYSNRINSKTPWIQCYGKNKKQAIAQFENACFFGYFDY